MPEKTIVQRSLFESLEGRKNILLVEPFYKRTLVPLPLMKISAYHKAKGDYVRYQRGEGWFINDYEPDIIYITSLFTWGYYAVVKTINSYKAKFPKAKINVGGTCASLLSKDIEKDTGVKPHFGAWDEIDKLMIAGWKVKEIERYLKGKYPKKILPSYDSLRKHKTNHVDEIIDKSVESNKHLQKAVRTKIRATITSADQLVASEVLIFSLTEMRPKAATPNQM